MRKLSSFLAFFLFFLPLFAQNSGGTQAWNKADQPPAFSRFQPQNGMPLTMAAYRITDAPKIDGILDEEVYRQNPHSQEGIFTQNEPANGSPASQPTRVHILYTDFSIYIAADLLDSAPDSILKELGLRDDLDRNTDMFAVGFDTWNNQQNAFIFAVSAAGVQSDLFATPTDEDLSWDAVWKSATHFHEKGWSVEMEIPYSALRFPKKEVQVWGMNFLRQVQRHQELSFWNPVDANVNGMVNQFGKLTGLEGLEPPVRLSFTPYVTGYLIQDSETGETGTNFTGGMDLKFGINQSFTLDMSLVPDFGQVQSDNVVLNLSPFEVFFQENRPFFTEGTELFSKGGIFYSRRVGQAFAIQGDIGENESLISSPSDAPLMNAVKVSGRTSNGLGIGAFNAITNKTFATVEDEKTGERRQVLADPVTNFNVLVFDQALKNNSSISLVNTNVLRGSGGRDANVTALDFSINDKNNRYRVRGVRAFSQIFTTDSATGKREMDLGQKSYLEFGKVSGKLRFNLSRNLETHNYNPNDLGYLQSPNEVSYNGEVGYVVNEPFSILNNFWAFGGGWYTDIHKPRDYDNTGFWMGTGGEFKNFWAAEINFSGRPFDRHDHFEARTEGYIFRKPTNFDASFSLSTDSRKWIRLFGYAGFWRGKEWDQFDYWYGFSPRFRINNKLTVYHDINFNKRRNERGFATKLYDEGDVLTAVMIGERQVQTITNTLGGSYTFNNRMGLNLRIRHYWSKVAYDRFWELHPEGELMETNYTGIDDGGVPQHDANFNAFNVDLVYSWQFAPGSFLNAVWKNSIYTDSPDTDLRFFENLSQTLQSPMVNSFSVRIVYFLDYLYIQKLFSGKKKPVETSFLTPESPFRSMPRG